MKNKFLIVCLVGLLGCHHGETEKTSNSSVPIEIVSPPVATTTAIVISEPPKPPSCPEGMVLIQKNHICMDKYEWPNQKDAYPDFAMNAFEASAHCVADGKRLCTHNEWLSACVGIKNISYGYGSFWKMGICNDTNNTKYTAVDWTKMGQSHEIWKAYAATLYKGTPSGSKENCFTDEGDDKIYDMIGNVREWVTDPHGLGGYAFESSFWYGTLSGPQVTCAFEIRVHSPKFASYEVGTRCCEDL